MLEQTMDRQKLSRMMDRSERMYLWNNGRETAEAESVSLIYVGRGQTQRRGAVAALGPSECNYLHSTA